VLFQSGAFDLGIMTRLFTNQPRTATILLSWLSSHGNHAAWAVYPLGLLYKIYPDVHWLLAAQLRALAQVLCLVVLQKLVLLVRIAFILTVFEYRHLAHKPKFLQMAVISLFDIILWVSIGTALSH